VLAAAAHIHAVEKITEYTIIMDAQNELIKLTTVKPSMYI